MQGDAGSIAEETVEAQSRMEALRKIPLFRHLTYKEQTAVLSIATTRTFPGGREIVVEGQPGEELFYDYGLIIDERYTAKLKKEYECRCGSPNCRRTMLAPKRR